MPSKDKEIKDRLAQEERTKKVFLMRLTRLITTSATG